MISLKEQTKKRYENYVSTDVGDVSQKANANTKWFKPFILEEQENKCAICGMLNIWNGKPLIFILDHIDGNANNNRRSNFRLICSNCDSQLDTYKSKNKNSARSYYRYRYKKEEAVEL